MSLDSLNILLLTYKIKRLLKNSLNSKDEAKRREVVKKVIAFMTLGLLINKNIILITFTSGIDVSRLFSEMCMVFFLFLLYKNLRLHSQTI